MRRVLWPRFRGIPHGRTGRRGEEAARGWRADPLPPIGTDLLKGQRIRPCRAWAGIPAGPGVQAEGRQVQEGAMHLPRPFARMGWTRVQKDQGCHRAPSLPHCQARQLELVVVAQGKGSWDPPLHPQLSPRLPTPPSLHPLTSVLAGPQRRRTPSATRLSPRARAVPFSPFSPAKTRCSWHGGCSLTCLGTEPAKPPSQQSPGTSPRMGEPGPSPAAVPAPTCQAPLSRRKQSIPSPSQPRQSPVTHPGTHVYRHTRTDALGHGAQPRGRKPSLEPASRAETT